MCSVWIWVPTVGKRSAKPFEVGSTPIISYSCIHAFMHSVPVTQWLECLSYEQEVVGSNPTRNILYGGVAHLVERPLCMRKVVGSSPTFSTNFLEKF